jgi:predicted MFS family arabinose efflux permease
VGTFGNRIIFRVGRRKILFLATLAVMAGAGLLCLAPGVYWSAAACAVIGIGGSFIPATAFAALADIHGNNRQIAINEASVASYVFGAAAPLMMSAVILAGLDWRSALLAGVAVLGLISLQFRSVSLPDTGRVGDLENPLPAAYWAYWVSVSIGIALEFCALLWAPAFLEHVTGLTQAAAAGMAISFVLGMLAGRSLGAFLTYRVGVPFLYGCELILILLGFGLYWGIASAGAAVFGLFLMGLGVALLFPLGVGMGMAVATNQSDKASARFMIAFGLALLLMPAILGTLADHVGLRHAHLLIPVLVTIAALAFALGRALEMRSRPVTNLAAGD